MSAEWFDAMLAMTLAGSLAIVVVLAVRIPLRHWFGAQVGYSTWIVVPLAALATRLPAAAVPAVAMLNVAHVFAALNADSLTPSSAVSWRSLAAIVWLIGGVATLAGFGVQQRRYLRGLGRLHAFDSAASVASIFYAESTDAGPAVVGAWSPRIVLPADFETRYTRRERELILAHEQVHRARGDTRINLILLVLRCLNWFNPLLHYAAARFRFDQELACDARVISDFPQARRSYADAMLKTQWLGQSQYALRVPIGCGWLSHPLTRRIAMLKNPLPTRSRRAIGIALVALLGVSSGYVAWAAQSSRPAAIAVAPGTQVDAQLKIRIDGGAETSARLVGPVGEEFALKIDDVSPAFEARFVARPVEGGNIELASTILRDGRIVGAPVIVMSPQQAGSIDVGAAGSSSRLHMQATLALHEAGWKPSAAASAKPVTAQ